MLILCLIFNNVYPCVFADYTSTYYAKVLYEQVYLYKSPLDDNSTNNIHFEIPFSYFVELIDNENDIFYKAKYLNTFGYVKKESVQAVETAPNSPFLDNINFRIYADLSRNLYSEPTSSSATSALIATIPLYSRNITYIGKIYGETLIDGRTNVWYYCKFSADKEYYGYVYSDFCDEIPSPFPTNTEEITFTTNPTFEIEQQPTTQSIPFNTKYTSIIVGILCVPALLFVFMIIKGKSFFTKEKPHNKEVIDY